MMVNGNCHSRNRRVLLLPKRPTFWRFSDYLCSAIEFLDKVQGNFRISFFIPSEDTPYLCGCSLVIYDAASAHSLWQEAEAAALPMGRSRLVRHPNLSCGGRLLCPRPLLPNHLLDQGCRRGCWPMPHVHQLEATERVLEDRKPRDS